jgi:hypothetical protein
MGYSTNKNLMNYPLKFLVFFWPNFVVFDIVDKIISQKTEVWEFKEVIVGSWNYLNGNQPQKISILHSMGFRRL